MKRLYLFLLCTLISSITLIGQNSKLDESGWVNFTSLDNEVSMYLDFDGPVTLQGIVEPPENRKRKVYHKKENARDGSVRILGAVKILEMPSSKISSLSVVLHKNLSTLDCSNNVLKVLAIDGAPHLRSLDCSNNQITNIYFDQKLRNLRELDCSNNKLRASMFDAFMAKLPKCLEEDRGKLYVKDFTQQDENTFSRENALAAQAKNWDVYAYFMDDNGNKEARPYEGEEVAISENIITYTTILPVGETLRYYLEAEGDLVSDGLSNINDMRGHMKSTILKQNSFIQGDVTYLQFLGAGFTEMDFSKNKSLSYVEVWGSGVKEIDFSNSPNISVIEFPVNWLETINIENCPNLMCLTCYQNNLSLDAVTKIVHDLPDQSKGYPIGSPGRPNPAEFNLIGSDENERNAMPTAELLDIAEQKNWNINIQRKDSGGNREWRKITKQDVTRVATPETTKAIILPNPAREFVSVEGASPYATVTLVDLLGKNLLESLCDSNGQLTLDTRAIPAGSYLLIVDGNSHKLIIAR